MTTEQSKPIALDEREVHPIFCMFGRYGPSVALGIIVMLSVWGVFIILHRTVRGQRRKKDENSAGTVGRKALKTASEEESRSYIESTGRKIMDSVEEVSKAQPSSVEEPGEAKLLPGIENIPDLCNEEPDELDWSATGEPNSVSESHGHGCSERDNGRHQTLGDPSEEKAAGVISEIKMKSLAGTMNQPPEHNFETTEINIMEATMENNEWMNVGSVEINKTISFPGKHLNGTAGMVDFGMGDNSDQSNQAKIDTAKESGTIPALLDGDSSSKRVAAVQPMPQMVGVSFCVHYITHSPLQLIAVTGNQQELGNWEKFVPLKKAKDGFWANSIALPADCQVEWKFVLVENGEIHRWEECNNRHLLTGNEEDIHLHKWWGCI
ncbi:hypothetical protein AGOR_G00010020 [Albula goreensis]|uniref:Starch-binding domain-containing protein 1 n=1 Tax=Albula goreensis TaxID=1534307 RepID=A0A8T3E7R8_9TELE|nr:hypothetical protein AGOR_G00010020 [Albula goreensis]